MAAADRLAVDDAALADAAHSLRRAADRVSGLDLQRLVDLAGLPGTDIAVEQERLTRHLAAGMAAFARRLQRLAATVSDCAMGYARADAELEREVQRRTRVEGGAG